MTVLDASALLALMFKEPGHEIVAEALASSLMSTVNLSEVLARFSRDGHEVASIVSVLQKTSIEFVEFSAEHARLSAEIAPACRAVGLSLGDRACLALAMQRNLPVLTADRAWLDLPLPVPVRPIR